jgi:hypothetical protein
LAATATRAPSTHINLTGSCRRFGREGNAQERRDSSIFSVSSAVTSQHARSSFLCVTDAGSVDPSPRSLCVLTYVSCAFVKCQRELCVRWVCKRNEKCSNLASCVFVDTKVSVILKMSAVRALSLASCSLVRHNGEWEYFSRDKQRSCCKTTSTIRAMNRICRQCTTSSHKLQSKGCQQHRASHAYAHVAIYKQRWWVTHGRTHGMEHGRTHGSQPRRCLHKQWWGSAHHQRECLPPHSVFNSLVKHGSKRSKVEGERRSRSAEGVKR